MLFVTILLWCVTLVARFDWKRPLLTLQSAFLCQYFWNILQPHPHIASSQEFVPSGYCELNCVIIANFRRFVDNSNSWCWTMSSSFDLIHQFFRFIFAAISVAAVEIAAVWRHVFRPEVSQNWKTSEWYSQNCIWNVQRNIRSEVFLKKLRSWQSELSNHRRRKYIPRDWLPLRKMMQRKTKARRKSRCLLALNEFRNPRQDRNSRKHSYEKLPTDSRSEILYSQTLGQTQQQV